MTLRPSHLRTHLVSTSRNIVLGETTDTRTYETRFGLRVRVKTICEMERIKLVFVNPITKQPTDVPFRGNNAIFDGLYQNAALKKV